MSRVTGVAALLAVFATLTLVWVAGVAYAWVHAYAELTLFIVEAVALGAAT